MRSIYYLLLIFILASCGKQQTSTPQDYIVPGAERTDLYLPLLRHRNVALVMNNTSRVDDKLLVDTLWNLGIKIKKIFTPEHGFEGNLDRGKDYQQQKLSYKGIPIISLAGRQKAPTDEQLSDIDIIVYDIQDVGVRFFTYISTLYEVMNAAAKNGKTLVILDRPDPNGDYVDGPVLDTNFRSFVGMLPIPVVYGLTPGELALMINGEHWLKGGRQVQLRVIPVKNYTHDMRYAPPVKPSPNLPNYKAIRLYPSLCFFEATDFSIGRGTPYPFQVIGYPDPKFGNFKFIPKDMPGMHMNPIHEGEICYGMDLRKVPDTTKFTLEFVMYFYYLSGWGEKFFKNPRWFDLLAGWDERQIRKSWKPELDEYKKMRIKYLLY